MDYIKTPINIIPKEGQKNKVNNIKLINNKNKKLFKNIYTKLSKYGEFKPADPLINRKYIKSKPIKFPSTTPTLTLPYFDYKSKNKIESFKLISNNTKSNYLYYNNNKDIQINNYINMSKMTQRLIYCKKPPDNGFVTIDNIINLNEIENKKNERNKKLIKEEKNEIKLNISDNINNLGISSEDIINFESNFECGNLQLTYLINCSKEKNEEKINNIFSGNINKEIDNYQLFLQNDTNTLGYSQWFFFRIKNGKKKQKINLNIMNFQRKTTRYANGLKVWYYSIKKKEDKNIGWGHTNENVDYYQNFLYRYIKGKRQYYYTLSFDYTFEYDNDEIYFANCIPFTYSDLIRDLNEYTKKENEKYFYFERKILCSTIIGNDVDYFTINNNFDLFNFEKSNNKKKGIVLFARQHPGETVGNWALKGAIELLMGESEEAKYLRDNFIIKIIPMINVDGVICGNSRTSLAGCDLNRRWINPNEYLHPEIYYLKELILNFVKKINVEYIIDFHGHFGAFNSFFYANNDKDQIEYCRKFPFICTKTSKIIQLNRSRFKMPKFKRGTGRINLYKELNIENIVTLETSFFGCNEGDYSNEYFNSDRLKEIGKNICCGIILSHYNSYLEKEIEEINTENLVLNFKNKIENKLNKINNEFDEYIYNLKNKSVKYNYINNSKGNKNIKNDEIRENIEQNSNEDENENENESDSESEPSRDNLEEEQIKILLPFFKKKKNTKKSKKNFNNFKNYYVKKNQISLIKNSNALTPQNKLSSFPKIDNSQTIISKNNNNKIITINHILYNNLKKQNINLSNKFLYKNRIRKNSPFIYNYSNKNSINIQTIIKEDKQTQTEDKFFKLHWSTFFGIYKILSPKYDDKKIDDSFSLITIERKYNNFRNNSINNNFKSPSTYTSFYRNIKENKNDSEKVIINRNNHKVKNFLNSDYYDKNNYLPKYIKKDYQKLSYSSEERIKGNRIKNNNKIKDKGNSIQKVIKSFISNITNLKKNDFLKRYLNNEDRIGQY